MQPVPESTSGAALLITGRESGNMSLEVGEGDAVAARAEALSRIGAALDDAVFAGQVHAARVARVGARERGAGASVPATSVTDVDALITVEAGVAVCIQVADCVPVALVATDPDGTARGVGAVHAGRGGVVSGVVGAAVAALVEAASVPPSSVTAVVGPAIGGCCYEVPAELALEVGTVIPGARGRTRWDTPSLDLPAAVRAQLTAAGVARIDHVGSCTRCEPERWFSHRAAQAGLAPHGRHLLGAMLDAPGAIDPSASLDFGP